MAFRPKPTRAVRTTAARVVCVQSEPTATIKFARAPIAHAAAFLKANKKDPVPLIVVGDTEGMKFIHQLSFMSLDESVNLRHYIRPPPETKWPDRKDAISLRESFTQLDDATSDHKCVYVLFHNGAAHDEPLLKRMCTEENYTIPSKFKFGDSVHVFKELMTASSYSEEKLYVQLFGTQPTCVSDEFRWHVAHFDVMQLRRMLRFSALYITDASQRDSPLSLTDARKRLLPEFPIQTAIGVLASWLTRPAARWRTVNEIKVKTTFVQPTKLTDAVYVSSKGKRHTVQCYMVKTYKLKICTDLALLAVSVPCQKCCYAKS